ncbi:MAG: precorrin-3B C(17)-methyltransferase, partial [Pseudomonadota bacterium]
GGGDLPIILVRNATHTDQTVHVTTVAAIAADLVDMRTLVIIGSSATRQVGKWLYTPRRVEVAP